MTGKEHQQQHHELNDQWMLWHTPNITQDLSSAYGSWEVANLKLTQNVHTLKTVEEFWTVFNALPPATKLPREENLMFFRSGVEPKWEDPAFKKSADKPAGGRFLCKLDPLSTADSFIQAVLVQVLGEQLSVDTDTASLVGGIRYVRKDNRKDVFVRVELWITDATHADKVKEVLLQTAQECKITNLLAHDNLAFKAF